MTAVAVTSRPVIMPTPVQPQTSTPAADQRSASGNWQAVNGYDRPKTDTRCVHIVVMSSSLLAAAAAAAV